ncbi:ATP-dependent 6-phosphofructokinase 4 chloroplastic [Phtheirospermum japonicum]|uniref:ATP-dependent 6-phosphofructokinase 4 chloroplastic n=1 Tax=Phtheirospermum japonicum TaxID=374723 RepID=A0A830CR94_9LAMI|nr:ATP-dependent 6-phosphofructokinase 4 chloroplastic [Phtheirospermum japonicum]
MSSQSNYQVKVVTGEFGYVLQDVPHLTDYIPNLTIRASVFIVHRAFVERKCVTAYPNPLRSNPAYSVVKQYFLDMDDTVPQKIVVHRDTPRGVHFRRAGPRERTYFASDEVLACIVTCGGLCPGLNTVIREIVHSLDCMYGVNEVLGIDEIRKRGLKVSVAGIPKTIDNDIPVIDKSFGFDTAVEEAQRAINAAHVEAESTENGIGVVKLMGRYCGFIAMYATLASRDVDCCLIPESPFYLEGEGGLFEYVEKTLKENGHMVIVIAEGAGQELLTAKNEQDASGNKLLQDVDPTYMIRAIPSNASDNVYCTLLAQSAVHGAMAGYTGFTCGLVNGRHTYIPFNRITEDQNKVVITDRMWARLLSSTNQPSFLGPKGIAEAKKDGAPPTQLLDDARDSKDGNNGGKST